MENQEIKQRAGFVNSMKAVLRKDCFPLSPQLHPLHKLIVQYASVSN